MIIFKLEHEYELPYVEDMHEHEFLIVRISKKDGRILKAFTNKFQSLAESYAKALTMQNGGLWIVLEILEINRFYSIKVLCLSVHERKRQTF
jgi:hypothetical protein